MSRNARRRVVLLIPVLLITLLSCGQSSPTLVVLVQDQLARQPLGGAECRVSAGQARSDSSGQCRLDKWATGDTLRVQAGGFVAQEVRLSGIQVTEKTRAVTVSVSLLPDRFTGVVLDAYDGQPITAARVDAPRSPLAVDAQGQFTVLTPTFPLTLTVQAPGYDSWQGSFLTKTARISLRPNTLEGQVLSADMGKPLAGAVVTVTGSSVVTSTTASDGRYHLAGVPEKFTLQAKAPRYRLATVPLARTTRYDLKLRPAFLRGEVRDQDGQPVAQARILCSGTYTHTDAAGSFFLPEVPEVAVVQVLAPGFAKESVTVTEQPSLTVALTPFDVEGIYITGYVAGTPDWFESLLDFVDKTDLNAVVIEVKDAYGALTYDSQLPLVKELGLSDPRYDVREVLQKCHERGIYTIAYIVTFEDSWLADARPEWAIQSKSRGAPWRNHQGLRWTDPYRKEVWEYNVSIARELAGLGFDEVQFDYIRFPTDGDVSDIVYSEETSVDKQYAAITGFVQYAYEQLAPTGAYVSADVFGYAAWRKMWEQGQDISLMTKYLDYLCPMAYPSHYTPGELGCANPASCPYKIVLETLRLAVSQMTEGQRARVRPWLQDFVLGGDPSYGPAEIAAQVRAAWDGGSPGFLLWNAGNVYTDGVNYGR